jgi:TatD DNase family protein
MQYEYFDIHSHIYFPDFDKDREEEIEKIKRAKIGTITIATGFESSVEAISLAEKHDNFFACVGQHPEEVTKDTVFDERINDLSAHPKVVAIGECGLDYFRMDPTDEVLKLIQKTIFEYQIDLSIFSEKPLMLHIRNSKNSQDAYLDTLSVLEHHAKISGDKLSGNAHFFAGDMEVLKRLLNIGFTVSFTGVITFARDYDELIKYVPLDMIMSETDAPFVAPVPHRGKRNSSLYIEEVVKKIAEIKNEPNSVVKNALVSNAKRVFGIL